jgi:hypothetical protein
LNRDFVIRQLLAILLIAGLALAPLSRPVMAATASGASLQAMADDMSATVSADEMASQMPCCPSKLPAPVGCDDCVCMAACASPCLAGMSTAVLHRLLTASQRIVPLKDDSWPDDLGHPPPEHPPRILV